MSIDKYLKALEAHKIDCMKCCGICCVALYYAAAEGFPCDKKAGVSCKYLRKDHQCQIHDKLFEKKLKGCMTYDCLGAGQFVTQKIYQGKTFQEEPSIKEQFFKVFYKTEALFQMRYYLLQAALEESALPIRAHIDELLAEHDEMVSQEAEAIVNLSLTAYQDKVNALLQQAMDLTHEALHQKPKRVHQNFYLGKHFKGADLTGKDFTVAVLIAASLEGCKLKGASFLGADMRDTNIKNTDLSESLYLTQRQINAAIGNQQTKLPSYLVHPSSWRS